MALTTARLRLNLHLRRALSLSSSFRHRATATDSLYPLLSRKPPHENRRWFHATHPSLFESSSLGIIETTDAHAMIFEGDANHCLVVMDFGQDPQQRPPSHQIIDIYVHTLAQVVGSVEEAKKKIATCSTTTHTCFQADIDEETAEKLKRMPGVIFVLPNSHLDQDLLGDEEEGNQADNHRGSLSGYIRGYMPQRKNIIGNNSPSGKGERGNPMSNKTNCSNEGRDHDQSGGNTSRSLQQGNYNQGMPFDQGNYSLGMPSHQGNYNHGENHAYDQPGTMSNEGRYFMPQRQNIPGIYSSTGEGGRGNPMSNRTNCSNEGGDHYQSDRNTFPSLQQGNYNQGMPSHQGNYSQGMPCHQGNYNYGGNYAYDQHGSMSREGGGYMPQMQNIPGNHSPTGEGGMGNPMSNRANCSNEGRDHYKSGGNPFPSQQQGNYNQGMTSHHGNYSQGLPSHQGNYNHGGNYAYNQHELISGEGRGYMPQRQNIPVNYSPTYEEGMGNPMSNRINYFNEGRDHYQSGGNTFPSLQQGSYNQGTPSHQRNYSQGMPSHQGNYSHGGNHDYNQHESISGEGRDFMPPRQNFLGNYSPIGEEGRANPISNEGRDHYQSGGNTFSSLQQQGYYNQGMPSHQGNYSQGMPSHQGNYNHGVPTHQGNYNQGYTQSHRMENFAAGDPGSHSPHGLVNNGQGDHGYNQSQRQIRNFSDNHGSYTPQGQMEYPGH